MKECKHELYDVEDRNVIAENLVEIVEKCAACHKRFKVLYEGGKETNRTLLPPKITRTRTFIR